jgi:hypothetical protein
MRHKKPLKLFEMEENMEKMRTNAEWLPEGDDDDVEGTPKRAVLNDKAIADPQRRRRRQRIYLSPRGTTKWSRHSNRSPRTSKSLPMPVECRR